MSKERRDILDILKGELEFIEKGGYDPTTDRPWIPTSMFQDSSTCLRLQRIAHESNCEDCALLPFVPPVLRSEEVPCHHIPLNSQGETVYTLERQSLHPEMEEIVKKWLSATIRQIEQERSHKQPKITTDQMSSGR
jgi:hypothetical protein